jgi:hypothetical protein
MKMFSLLLIMSLFSQAYASEFCGKVRSINSRTTANGNTIYTIFLMEGNGTGMLEVMNQKIVELARQAKSEDNLLCKDSSRGKSADQYYVRCENELFH